MKMDEDLTFPMNGWDRLMSAQEKLELFVDAVRMKFIEYPPDKQPLPLRLSYELVLNILSFVTCPDPEVDNVDVELDKEILHLRLVSKAFAAAAVDVLLRRKLRYLPLHNPDKDSIAHHGYTFARSREVDYHLKGMCFLTNYKSILPTALDVERFAQVVSSPHGRWGSLITELDFVLKRDHFEVVSPSMIHRLPPRMPIYEWWMIFMDIPATEMCHCHYFHQWRETAIRKVGVSTSVATGDVFGNDEAVRCPVDDRAFSPHRMKNNRNFVHFINSIRGRQIVKGMLASMPNLKQVRIGTWPMFTKSELKALSEVPETQRSSDQYRIASRHFFRALRFATLFKMILGPVDPGFFGYMPFSHLKQVSFAQSLIDLDISIVYQIFDNVSISGTKRWHTLLKTCANLERLAIRFSASLNDGEYLDEWWIETILANQEFKHLKNFTLAEFKTEEAFLSKFFQRHSSTLRHITLDAVILREPRRLHLLNTLRKLDLENFSIAMHGYCQRHVPNLSCFHDPNMWSEDASMATFTLVHGLGEQLRERIEEYATGKHVTILPEL